MDFPLQEAEGRWFDGDTFSEWAVGVRDEAGMATAASGFTGAGAGPVAAAAAPGALAVEQRADFGEADEFAVG